jgi:hypothetical protein
LVEKLNEKTTRKTLTYVGGYWNDKKNGVVLTGLISLMMGTSVMLLWTRKWTSGFRKCWGIQQLSKCGFSRTRLHGLNSFACTNCFILSRVMYVTKAGVWIE